LAAIVGNKALPRSQAIKLTWDYIKKNGLQDTKNRRNINSDSKLSPLFGGKKQVSMFELASIISKNLK
jgi:chromatin remodeling complex protein RSC6